jgi:hypothetical protein
MYEKIIKDDRGTIRICIDDKFRARVWIRKLGKKVESIDYEECKDSEIDSAIIGVWEKMKSIARQEYN